MAGLDDWKRWVVYQIYPRSFCDGSGDGVGDLRGIIQTLDHLAILGVDVVWLSPVYRSPIDDNGYDISDYQDIDRCSARSPIAKRWSPRARPRHPPGDGPRRQPHLRRAPLVRRVARAAPPPSATGLVATAAAPTRPARRRGPNNSESAFGGSAWEYDDARGAYYLHLFSPKQPDLNWEMPRPAACTSMMRSSLDRGVDGFRMDVMN